MEVRMHRKWSKQRLTNQFRRFGPIYLMAVPGLLYFLINNYIPMAGIILAFKDYNVRKGLFGSPWSGIDNFRFLFMTQDAWVITRNTILYNVGFILLGTVVAVMTAILLNEVTQKHLSKAYQTIILLPYLISMVVVSYITYAFLSMDTGLLNNLIRQFGGTPVFWYNEAEYWPAILTFIHVWKNFGFNTIIYYAVIVGIDSSLFEAATVDGASRWKQILHVTLPSLKPTVVIMTILAVGRIFYSDFGLFYQVPMNSGMLFSTTNVIDTYVYRALFNMGDYGMSSAASLYQSVVGFLLVIGANGLVRKIDRENAMF